MNMLDLFLLKEHTKMTKVFEKGIDKYIPTWYK